MMTELRPDFSGALFCAAALQPHKKSGNGRRKFGANIKEIQN